MIVTDSKNYYWNAAPNYEEAYYLRTSELDGPVFFDYEGQYIGVYPNGYVYYGEVTNSERSGHGLWYDVSEYGYMIVDCTWSDDKPNGHADIYSYRDESKMDKQPNYTYYTYSAHESVDVINGIYDGESTLILYKDAGESHEWHVTYANGYMQTDGNGYASICVDCGAKLGLGDYQYTVYGIE